MSNGLSGIYLLIKGIVERCAAILAMILVAPLLAALALMVKWASPGPAFYSQTRLGLNGRIFRIWKLRTMYHNCEKSTGPVWASTNDHRVTRIGRVLRDTHLDELPQLWNVMRGEMSMIGPRPERPEIARRIAGAVPGFDQRLKVKPGLTGMAQLSLPADSDIARVPHKLAHDLYYMRHQGLLLDLRIVLSTVFHLSSKVFASASRLLMAPVHARGRIWETSAVLSDTIVSEAAHSPERAAAISAAA